MFDTLNRLVGTFTGLRSRVLGAAACAGALSLAGAHAEAQSCTTPLERTATTPGVYGDDWGRSTGTPGALLGCFPFDQLTPFYTGGAATTPDYVANAKRAIAFRYVTTDAVNNRVPATAVLLVPSAIQRANGGVSPIVAIGTGTAGVIDECAPSRVLRKGPGLVGGSAAFYLKLGFTVVVVDYIGLGTKLGAVDGDDHPYLEGDSAAHVMIDALRAARQVPGGHYASNNAPVDANWPLVVDGYSQGGSAAQWAALRARSYGGTAAQFPLKAAVVGAPAIDLDASVRRIDTGVFRSLFGMAFHSLTNSTDPNTRLTQAELFAWLTPTGQALYNAMRTNCAVDYGGNTVFEVLFGAYHLSDLIKNPNPFSFQNKVDAFLQQPKVAAFLDKNSVKFKAGPNKFLEGPAMPVLGIHGMADDVNPYSLHYNVMVNDWQATLGGTTLNIDANLARTDRALQGIAFSTHLTSSGALRNTSNLDQRYAPAEWVWDSVFGANRTDATDPALKFP
jgi:Secretory lipase